MSDIALVKSISFQPVGDDDTIKCFITLEWVQNSGKNPKFSGLVIFKRDVQKTWVQSGLLELTLIDVLKVQKESSPVKVVTGKEFKSYCEIELFTV
jgi:hypothetical protein